MIRQWEVVGLTPSGRYEVGQRGRRRRFWTRRGAAKFAKRLRRPGSGIRWTVRPYR